MQCFLLYWKGKNMPVIITSYGHACYKIEYNNASVILDPYENGSVPGLQLPEGLEADRVLCSHGHHDHNARGLVRETDKNPDAFSPVFINVPHDDAGGSKRGMSDISVLHAGKVTIIHFGDIGRLPEEDEYRKMEGADIILIPAGGYYTIDAEQAKEICERICPKAVILMHFRKGEIGYPVLADFDAVKAVFPDVKTIPEGRMIFAEDSVPEGIFVLDPVQ